MLRRLLPLLPRHLRHTLIRRNFRYDESELEGVEVSVADQVSEYVDAAKLLYDGYLGRGMISPHGAGVRFTPYLALPSTLIFVAKRHGTLVGTLSLVIDRSIHLPMDKVFREELEALRAQGRRLAEVGALCVAKGVRGLGIPFLLYKTMWLTTRLLPIDDLVVAVRPSIAESYQAMLLFEPIADARPFPGLLLKVVGLRLRLDDAVASFHKAFGHLPKNQQNPLYMYVERDHPQIRIPTDPDFNAALRPVRMQAAVKLAALRPDTILDLDPSDFEHLQEEFD